MVLNLQIADFSYTLQIVKWILFACLNTHCMKKCLCSSVYNCRPWLALFPGSTAQLLLHAEGKKKLGSRAWGPGQRGCTLH
jgi:hypothetical protein